MSFLSQWSLAVIALLFLSVAEQRCVHAFAPVVARSAVASHCATSAIGVATTSSSVDSTADTTEQPQASPKIRPIHQNWWPVTLVNALDPIRPNAIQLLGKRLVLWNDDGAWSCLDDRCSHRFAPLSEGRIVTTESSNKCLQCAYHGWEFDASGSCRRIPQAESTAATKTAVSSYPVREDGGMLWVWSDPASAPQMDEPLPISPLLRRHVEASGVRVGFMRDLPYGMELLGENLLDLSHLPFSHHSVGSLNRRSGGPLPLRMLSESERQTELELTKDASRLPIFQAQVEDAANRDPIFAGLASFMPVPENSTSNIGFYEPHHVRYRRYRGVPGTNGHVELFMCPTAAGKSRVILFNAVEAMLPSPEEKKERPTLRKRLSQLRPSMLKKKVKQVLLKRFGGSVSVQGHMMSHAIFDGDGIFLHKQGNRMDGELTYRNYATPTSADVLVNAYRRYLDAAANQAPSDVAGAVLASEQSVYTDTAPRSVLLDRYQSHTVNCRICSSALKKCEQQRHQCDLAGTALVGAAGASALGTATALLLSVSGNAAIPAVVVRALGMALGASFLGAAASAKAKASLDAKIQQFHFVDYVHADKH